MPLPGNSCSLTASGDRRLASTFLACMLLVVAAMPLFCPEGQAGAYKRIIRNGRDNIIIPQDSGETKRLFGDNYQYLDRNHLVFISDVEQRALVQLVQQDFQAYLAILTRQLFTKAMNSHSKDSPEIPIIFLFKDRASYVKGLRSMGIATGEGMDQDNLRDGYHFGGKDLSFILINYQEKYAHGLAVYAHELTHALVRKEYPTAPIWINEGLATMFQYSMIEGGQLQYKGSGSRQRMRQALAAGRAVSLAQLFSSTGREFMGADHGQFYDAAELLCRFLSSRNLLIPVYIEMREGRGKGVNGSESVARITGRTLENLEKDWHNWLNGQE